MRHKKSDSRPFRHKMRIDVTRLTYANAHPYCRSYYNSKSIPFQIPLSTSASSRTEALVYLAEAESIVWRLLMTMARNLCVAVIYTDVRGEVRYYARSK